MIKLLNMSYREALKVTEPVRMIFCDPPDGIGLGYAGFNDKFDDYAGFINSVLLLSMVKADVIWLSYNAKHTFMVGELIHGILDYSKDFEAKPFVQVYSFGQHNHHDCGNGHRPLVRLMRKGTELYPDHIRVPSWRQQHGDKRADPRGRVPSDVFDFPRVVGNSKQRRKFSPTQLHEGLYTRCIKLCCKPGDTVMDLFAGSGTLGRVAERCEVNAIMVEISKITCDHIAKDQNLCMTKR